MHKLPEKMRNLTSKESPLQQIHSCPSNKKNSSDSLYLEKILSGGDSWNFGLTFKCLLILGPYSQNGPSFSPYLTLSNGMLIVFVGPQE
jgi:hypothetical protein